MLATSRERLNIPGEVTFQVPPLALPHELERAPERLARSEAVRLFVERARLVAPDFALTPENAPSVAEVCRRLDGLPLAIELAAARVRLLRVEQIVARLNDRFRLLTGGSRTTLPRHQTLRAALDWSHDLLSPPEQMLLRRLSVFAGGFTLEAVEGICTGPGVAAAQALDVLAQLVDKSMVIVETDPAASVARYRLLETIREYCHEQASAAGEVAQLRTRHRAWFLALAEEAQRRGQGAEQVEWLDRLETEYDNLKAALSWRDQDSASHVFRLRLGAALWRFWEVRGLIREGRDWLESILADTGHDAPGARARALNGAGNLARDLGDYERAAEHHAEALRLRREVGDTLGVAASLNNLGAIAHDRARYASAEACFSEALPTWREASDQEGLALSLNNLGRTRRFQGDYEQAAALGHESLGLFRAIDHAWGIARALNSLANTAHYQGDVAGARPLYEESLRLRRLVGDRSGIAVSLNSLALLRGLAGEIEAARELANEALALRRDLGDRRGIGGSLLTLGSLALWGDRLDEARHLARESLGIRSTLGDRLGIACCLEVLGEEASARAQLARAARLLEAADAERASINAPLPPLERERRERVLAALGNNRSEGAGKVAGLEALITEELRAARHIAGLPGPAAEIPGTRMWSKDSGQEAEGQRGMATNPTEARAQRPAEGRQIGRAVIRELARLHVAPHRLDGIQFGGVGRQALNGQPGALSRHVFAHPSTGVRAEPVPQQDNPLSAEVALEGPQKRQERGRRVGARPGLEVQPGAAAVPAKGERRRDGQPFPVVEDVRQDRGLAARRPGAPDDGLLREPAFVLEDEPGPLTPGVFFTAGHRTWTHRRMATSSRSTAWRAGRWSDQFKRRRIRQTWPG